MSKSTQSAFIMAISSAFLLWGYEILRSSSMALIKDAYGSSIIIVLLILSPIFLSLMLLLQSYVLNRFGTRKTFLIIGSGAAFSIFGTWLAVKSGFKAFYIVLGVLQECYGLLLIEQYWSHINSILTVSEGKRLNGRILAISTLGGIFGGFSLKAIVGVLSSSWMPLITVLSMIPCLLIADYAFKICPSERKNTPKKDQPAQWQLFQKNPTLISLFLMVGASQIYSAVVTVNFHTALQEAIPNVDQQSAWGGTFFSFLHISALCSQLFLSPFLLRSFSPRQVLLGIPLLQGLIFFLSQQSSSLMLATAAAAMLIFKSLDYSIFRTSKETLYIPMSFEERYIAKGWIDVLGYRFGKALGSLGIKALTIFGIASPFILPLLGFTSLGLWMIGAKNTNSQEQPLPRSVKVPS